MSWTSNRSSAAEMPKPPTSVSPASRRKSSLAQAVGLNRRADSGLHPGRCGKGLSFEFLTGIMFLFLVLLVVTRAAGDIGTAASAAALWHAGQISRQDGQYSLPQTMHFSEAAATIRCLATLAGTRAAAAEHVPAMLTMVPLLLSDVAAATVARDAAPIAQLDVGATPAVRVQHLRDQQEEVIEPPRRQGRGDGRLAFALAEPFVPHVRMGDLVAPGGRMGVEGHNAVRPARMADVDCQSRWIWKGPRRMSSSTMVSVVARISCSCRSISTAANSPFSAVRSW